MSHQPLDSVPIVLFVALFVAINPAVYEIGYRTGPWSGGEAQRTLPDEGPTGIIVGAILGLMAFLLAITMGMALSDSTRAVSWSSPRRMPSARLTYAPATSMSRRRRR